MQVVTSGRKGPGGRSRDKSGALAIESRERHARWVEMRKRGMSYMAIAAVEGVQDSTVHEAVTRRIAEMIPRENVEAVRALELARLDEQYERVHAVVEQESDPAMEAVLLKVSERRAKLLGLDAPTKVQVEQQAVDIDELRKLLNSYGYDIVPLVEAKGEGVE